MFFEAFGTAVVLCRAFNVMHQFAIGTLVGVLFTLGQVHLYIGGVVVRTVVVSTPVTVTIVVVVSYNYSRDGDLNLLQEYWGK